MAVLSISEAAQTVGVTPSTLYKRIRTGTLHATTRPDGSKGVETEELTRIYGKLKQAAKPETAETGIEEEAPVPHETEQLRQELKASRARVQHLQSQVTERWLIPGAVWDFFKLLDNTVRHLTGKD